MLIFSGKPVFKILNIEDHFCKNFLVHVLSIYKSLWKQMHISILDITTCYCLRTEYIFF